jgi:hypothetical protein
MPLSSAAALWVLDGWGVEARVVIRRVQLDRFGGAEQQKRAEEQKIEAARINLLVIFNMIFTIRRKIKVLEIAGSWMTNCGSWSR